MEREMSCLNRRQLLGGTAVTVAAAALGAPSVHAQKHSKTIRFVAQADLKILDPVWTTAYITRNHGYLVYDTLFGTDETRQIKPQMVDHSTVSADGMKYTFTLRDGLRWHDGQPVGSEDCVESLKRWGKKDRFGGLLMAHTGKIASVDRKTFTLELAERFGPVLDALGKPSSNVPFIMPARLATTDANEQIKEVIGSGPYRFVKAEWQPGDQVVYERFADYVPRNEAPSGAAGGKRANVDRVIARYIPDAATASAALEKGEVDWWDNPPVDFSTRLEKNPNITVFVKNPGGIQGWVRPNHLFPPFNNKKARQALLHMVDQDLYLQAVVGNPKYYRACPSYFMCGLPTETAAGAPGKPNLERARQLMKESGYDGKPIVLLDAADNPSLHGSALVTRELLSKIGVNVDLQAQDWASVIARRGKKDPPQAGGWNLMMATWISPDVMTPAVNAGLSGGCDKAWFGWYCSEQMESLRREWIRATEPAKRKQIADQVQTLAYDEVPYVPWGQYTQPTAYRKNVKGVLTFPASLYWNVSVEG
jgi:peptide/nickel transport system substrate-binding protein